MTSGEQTTNTTNQINQSNSKEIKQGCSGNKKGFGGKGNPHLTPLSFVDSTGSDYKIQKGGEKTKDFSKIAICVTVAFLMATMFIMGRVTAPQIPPQAHRSPQKRLKIAVNDNVVHIADTATGKRYRVILP